MVLLVAAVLFTYRLRITNGRFFISGRDVPSFGFVFSGLSRGHVACGHCGSDVFDVRGRSR